MEVRAGLRRVVLTLLMFLTASAGATAADQQDQREGEPSLKRWTYPNATPREVVLTTRTGGSVRSDTGQYSTADPFHEVVRFYVERSGLEPPNWSILGRKFPGDTGHIPGSWSKSGETEGVTVHHHIRPDSAIAGVLVSDCVLPACVQKVIPPVPGREVARQAMKDPRCRSVNAERGRKELGFVDRR
jgi:hypothetical protein